jgi:hypothetical protein
MKTQKITMSTEEKKRLEVLKKKVSDEINALKSLSDDEKRQKNDNIISMIRHYVNMSDQVEDRRGRIRTFTLQMLAIWVAAVLLLTAWYFDKSVDIPIIFFSATLALFIGQILFCLYSAFVYERQSGFRYPFLWPEAEEYGNKWKWFYYGSKPLQRISTKTIIGSKTFGTTIEPYLESFRDFINEYRLENLDSEIIDNIQQLHLLRVHNYFKNKFYLQLTDIQKQSLYALPATAAIGAIIALICQHF